VASAAFLMVPLLALAGAWFLLTAVDGGGRRPRAGAAGLLAGAVVMAGVGIAADDHRPAPSPHGTTAAAV
jgi:hypothetical protein